MAAEIRCYHCGRVIIERAAPPWRYTCPRCKEKRSSTGLIAPARLDRIWGQRAS